MAHREAVTNLVNSAGFKGLDLKRSGNRGYLIVDKPIYNGALSGHESELLKVSLKNGKRRSAFRYRGQKPQQNGSLLSIEATIPLEGTPDYIITKATNFEFADEPKARLQAKLEFPEREVKKTALERIDHLTKSGEYKLSNWLSHDDAEDLMRLWWVFGWTWNGIHDFIDQYNTSPEAPWFSAIRDKGNKIISAVQGDMVEYANHLSVEVTEFSTLPDLGGKGLCTAALAGLLSQIISDTMYKNENHRDRNPKNLPVLIYSELNLDSHPMQVAQALGFNSPVVVSVDGNIIDQTLLENIYVFEKKPEMEKYWMSLTDEQQKEALKNPDFYKAHLRNFVVMSLSNDMIADKFNYYDIEQILEHYKLND